MTNAIVDVPTRLFLVNIDNIIWDVSSADDFDNTPELPRSLTAVVEVQSPNDFNEEDLKSIVVPEILSDMITEEFGFCHEGYDIESINDYDGDEAPGIIDEFYE